MLFSFLDEKVAERKDVVTLNTSTIKTLGLNLGSLVSLHISNKHVSLGFCCLSRFVVTGYFLDCDKY